MSTYTPNIVSVQPVDGGFSVYPAVTHQSLMGLPMAPVMPWTAAEWEKFRPRSKKPVWPLSYVDPIEAAWEKPFYKDKKEKARRRFLMVQQLKMRAILGRLEEVFHPRKKSIRQYPSTGFAKTYPDIFIS